MKTSKKIEKALEEFVNTGHIIPRTENNSYLKVSYKGAGKHITDKWNVKIYKTGTLVTTDTVMLNDIVDGSFHIPDGNLQVIKIDDAGIGFPLCGIMVGVDNGQKIQVDTVDVSYFQGDLFKQKKYLDIYTKKGLTILRDQHITPDKFRVEICSGHINKKLKAILRKLGFQVSITNITGALQDGLEEQYRRYILRQTKKDIYYDPKMIPKNEIGKYYNKTLKWAYKYAPNLIKSGWSSIKQQDFTKKRRK